MDLIYEDLDVLPDVDVEYKKVQTLNKELIKKITLLETEVAKFNDTLAVMKKQQEDLERNISSLYNTAKAECERKDKRIDELQKKLDDISFRREGYRHPVRSDSSRHGSHTSSYTSRSESPLGRDKDVGKDGRDHRERRVSPRKRDNKDSKDIRDRDRDRDRKNRRQSPAKRSRTDDRKSPPSSKRSKYEHRNERSEKDKERSEKNEKEVHKNRKNENPNSDKVKTTAVKTTENIAVITEPKVIESINISYSEEEGELVDYKNLKKSNKNHLEVKKSEEKPTSVNHPRQPNIHENNKQLFQQQPEEVLQPKIPNTLKPELNFTGMLKSEETKKNLFAPKPSTALSADILFGNSPLTTTTTTKPPKLSPVINTVNCNVTASNFNLNNSAIINSTQITSHETPSSTNSVHSVSISVSSEGKSLNSSDESTMVTQQEVQTIDKENIENKLVTIVGDTGDSVSVEGVGSSPVGLGRGKPRPRRRGGVVKMID